MLNAGNNQLLRFSSLSDNMKCCSKTEHKTKRVAVTQQQTCTYYKIVAICHANKPRMSTRSNSLCTEELQPRCLIQTLHTLCTVCSSLNSIVLQSQLSTTKIWCDAQAHLQLWDPKNNTEPSSQQSCVTVQREISAVSDIKSHHHNTTTYIPKNIYHMVIKAQGSKIRDANFSAIILTLARKNGPT